jgi:uncharacterized membrane protein
VERRVAVVQTELIHFSGPVPSPAMLREYGTILEDGAERVFRMAEAQAMHRREVEKIVLLGGARVQFLGLAVAAVWSAALAYGAWALAHEGRSLLGVAALIAALTPAGVFVYGRRSQAEERLRRAVELERAARPRSQQEQPVD